MGIGSVYALTALDDLFDGVTLYAGLLLATGVEVAASGYARTAFQFDEAEELSGFQLVKNTAQILLPNHTVTWGTPTHVAVYTLESAGTLVAKIKIDDPEELLPGARFLIDVGTLVIRIKGD